MGTFVLKRKTFSEDKKEGMSLGKKIAIGAAGVGALALGAKKGIFGANIQNQANMLQGKLGLGMMNNATKGLQSTGALPSGPVVNALPVK